MLSATETTTKSKEVGMLSTVEVVIPLEEVAISLQEAAILSCDHQNTNDLLLFEFNIISVILFEI